MRSIRSLLPLGLRVLNPFRICALVTVVACSAPVVAPATASAPVDRVPVQSSATCQDEAQAEKAYYEAQRLFQKKRYWEAAPAFVISFNFCNHPQVLCAAGQAYRRAQKCEKSSELLHKCLSGDVPLAARTQAEKLLASARACERDPTAVATRGEPAEASEPDDAGFGAQPWATAADKSVDGKLGAP